MDSADSPSLAVFCDETPPQKMIGFIINRATKRSCRRQDAKIACKTVLPAAGRFCRLAKSSRRRQGGFVACKTFSPSAGRFCRLAKSSRRRQGGFVACKTFSPSAGGFCRRPTRRAQRGRDFSRAARLKPRLLALRLAAWPRRNGAAVEYEVRPTLSSRKERKEHKEEFFANAAFFAAKRDAHELRSGGGKWRVPADAGIEHIDIPLVEPPQNDMPDGSKMGHHANDVPDLLDHGIWFRGCHLP